MLYGKRGMTSRRIGPRTAAAGMAADESHRLFEGGEEVAAETGGLPLIVSYGLEKVSLRQPVRNALHLSVARARASTCSSGIDG